MTYRYHYDSPLGGITMASDGTALTGLWLDGQKYFASTMPKDCKEKPLKIFEFTPQLSLESTTFRKEVWEILLSIPYGKTMTYGEIAKKIAEQRGLVRMSAQAVGGAVGHNPISIIVPCHRVVGTNGSLTGYAGGIEKKMQLLELEGGLEKQQRKMEKCKY